MSIDVDGLYILADDSVEDLALACLNSLRTVEPFLPICFIPFGPRSERMLSVAQRYRLAVWKDEAILQLCDEVSLLFHQTPTGHYRKLAVWLGRFDRFLYLDVDTLVLQPLEPVFRHLERYDVLTAVSNKPAIRRFVWTGPLPIGKSPVDAEYAANTGFLASKHKLFSYESLRNLATRALSLKSLMALDCAEQPFLNYIITTSGVRYSSLSELRKQDKSVPIQMWAGRWSGRLLDLPELPLFIHWAGAWRSGRHKASPAWRHFRDLPVPPE
jgi:hypothetical protein